MYIKLYQKAFSLLEMLMVLIGISLLIVISFLLFDKVQTGKIATEESQMLSSAVAEIKSVYSSGDYTGLNTATARNIGAFPKSMNSTTAGQILNRWDTTIDVYPSGANGVANATKYFTINYKGTPSEVCIKLIPALANIFGTILVVPYNPNGSLGTGAYVINRYNSVSTDDDVVESQVINLCGKHGAYISLVSK